MRISRRHVLRGGLLLCAAIILTVGLLIMRTFGLLGRPRVAYYVRRVLVFDGEPLLVVLDIEARKLKPSELDSPRHNGLSHSLHIVSLGDHKGIYSKVRLLPARFDVYLKSRNIVLSSENVWHEVQSESRVIKTERTPNKNIVHPTATLLFEGDGAGIHWKNSKYAVQVSRNQDLVDVIVNGRRYLRIAVATKMYQREDEYFLSPDSVQLLSRAGKAYQSLARFFLNSSLGLYHFI